MAWILIFWWVGLNSRKVNVALVGGIFWLSQTDLATAWLKGWESDYSRKYMWEQLGKTLQIQTLKFNTLSFGEGVQEKENEKHFFSYFKL